MARNAAGPAAWTSAGSSAPTRSNSSRRYASHAPASIAHPPPSRLTRLTVHLWRPGEYSPNAWSGRTRRPGASRDRPDRAPDQPGQAPRPPRGPEAPGASAAAAARLAELADLHRRGRDAPAVLPARRRGEGHAAVVHAVPREGHGEPGQDRHDRPERRRVRDAVGRFGLHLADPGGAP